MSQVKNSKRYSIAKARDHLAQIVHDAERGTLVELTRRGEPVAVLVSAQEYQHFREGKSRFWEKLQEFRKRVDLRKLGVKPEDWERLRDSSSGRPVEF